MIPSKEAILYNLQSLSSFFCCKSLIKIALWYICKLILFRENIIWSKYNFCLYICTKVYNIYNLAYNNFQKFTCCLKTSLCGQCRKNGGLNGKTLQHKIFSQPGISDIKYHPVACFGAHVAKMPASQNNFNKNINCLKLSLIINLY